MPYWMIRFCCLSDFDCSVVVLNKPQPLHFIYIVARLSAADGNDAIAMLQACCSVCFVSGLLQHTSHDSSAVKCILSFASEYIYKKSVVPC